MNQGIVCTKCGVLMNASKDRYVCELAKFEASIREWSDSVQNEIATRERPTALDEVSEYNQHIVFGLKLSYAMMQDAMRRRIE